MKPLKPQEKKKMNKIIENHSSKEETKLFLKERSISEVKLYAKLFNSHLYSMNFMQRDLEVSRELIIEDLLSVIWGD